VSDQHVEIVRGHAPAFEGWNCRGCTESNLQSVNGDGSPRWITTAQLVEDCHRLAAMLPADIAGVAGVPRSGLVAAGHVALTLSAPLFEITPERGLQPCGYGRRLEESGRKPAGPLAVIDDSANTGRSLRMIRDLAPAGSMFAAVYATPQVAQGLDACAVVLPMPHYFQWHFPGSDMVTVLITPPHTASGNLHLALCNPRHGGT
jgi:hypothetical protein